MNDFDELFREWEQTMIGSRRITQSMFQWCVIKFLINRPKYSNFISGSLTYEIIILFLFEQLQGLLRRMKGRSGLNETLQSHKHCMTNASLLNFLRMAKNHHLGSQSPNSQINQAIIDHYHLGTSKLISQARVNELQRFPKMKYLTMRSRLVTINVPYYLPYCHIQTRH